MSPRRIIVQQIACTRTPKSEVDTLGFQVSGFKASSGGSNSNPYKVGFILSGVKLITFQQVSTSGIRTRLKWIPTGFEIREEINPLDRSLELERKNNVLFINREDNSAVVLQGEPQIQKQAFIGQIVQIQWEDDNVTIFSLNKKSRFHCALNPRNNRVDCLVK